MNDLKIIVLVLISFISTNCQYKNKKEEKKIHKMSNDISKKTQAYEKVYFAGGCFWCVEAIFESVKGVKEVVSGYSGGVEKNPTYKQVSYGKTTHAEAVEVYYDPKKISYLELVEVFFGSHDPTSLNRQGPDKGIQYRSIAFYRNNKEKKILEDYISKLTNSGVYNRPIVTEIAPFTKFYKAEDYHQNYEKLNPADFYIQNISIPRLNKFKKNFPEFLKKEGH